VASERKFANAASRLEALLDRDPMAAERSLSVIADWLAAMSTVRSPSLGKVAFVNAGGRSLWTTTKLNRGGLDEDRLRFYQLCMHLNLVAGPLRMADTSHPEHEWFRRLAEHHLQLVLQFQA
jgi:hypothetical protein